MTFIGSRVFTIVWLWLLAPIAQAQDDREPPIIFAASSLTSVLQEQAENWAASTNTPKPRLSFGASATMARQIQAGAPAHLFFSAHPKWAKLLEQSGHTRRVIDIASNQLVLVAPHGLQPAQAFKPTAEHFAALLNGRRLALADPTTAPAGAYARAFLQKSGLWDTLQHRVAYAQNVRQALRLSVHGGLPAFVYNSDATASSAVDILYAVPAEMTDTIIYQAALLKRAEGASTAFVQYLLSETAAPIWQKHGFRKIASN